MTHTYLYILGWLLMWLTAVPVQAQDVAGEDETVGGLCLPTPSCATRSR